MVFDGTRENCPNKDDEGGLDMSYIYFTDYVPIRDDPSFGTRDFNRECFNICEAKPPGLPNRPVPTYIEDGVCKLCPDPENDDSDDWGIRNKAEERGDRRHRNKAERDGLRKQHGDHPAPGAQ